MALQPAINDMRVKPIKKRFWWPHPYARPYLWRKLTIGYKYIINGFELEGLDTSQPIPPIPDQYLTWPGKSTGAPKPPIVFRITEK